MTDEPEPKPAELKRRLVGDTELLALADLIDIITGLTLPAQARVVAYLIARWQEKNGDV